jgi:uncharacterized membrane protein
LLASLTIADSWLLVPTMFTLHYADMFYSADPHQPPLILGFAVNVTAGLVGGG